jgi:hypothetical protein
MKKIIITLAILAFASQGIWAQTQSSTPMKKVDFNLELAPAITWMSIDNKQVDSDGSNVKLNIGMNVNWNLAESYAFVSGLRLNTFGGDLTGNNGTTSETVLYEIQEFEIPIGMKFRTPEVIENMRFTFNLGLGFGIAFKAHATKTYPSDLSNFDYENDEFDYKLMPFRGIYNIGAGIEYNLSGLTLTGRLNYKGSLTSVYFYDGSMGSATNYLDLNSDYQSRSRYNESIKFFPNAFEIAVGVIF